MAVSGYKWPNDEELPFEWEWPEGTPCDYDELVREYGDFVARAVARYNKVDRNFRDLLQEVWSKLLSSQVLEKFVDSSARRLPEMMTAREACDLLGLEWPQWKKAMQRRKFLPNPVQGTRCSRTAVFKTMDVIDMDDVMHTTSRPQPRVRPPLSSRGFKAYLQRAIHNHFANWCRTRSRRYKEQLLSPQSVLGRESDGCFQRKAEIEGVSSWENSITQAGTLDEEDMVDLLGTLRKANFDINSDEGVEVLDFLTRQGRSCVDGPQRNLEVLELIGHGYSLSEAVKCMSHRVRLQKILMRG
jgi:hypothetical protein